MGGPAPISRSTFDFEDAFNVMAPVRAVTIRDPRLPDPRKYTLIKQCQTKSYLILHLRYDGCTNYEGQKILVFQGVTLSDLTKQGLIDPHFSENKKYHSPIARFEPSPDGWAMAFKLCSILEEE